MYQIPILLSLAWKEFTDFGLLKYPNFLETVTQMIPLYAMRLTGGLLYFTGVCIMVYNLIGTVRQGSFVANEDAESMPFEASHEAKASDGWHRWIEGRPVKFTILSLIAVAIGGALEIIPLAMAEINNPTIATVKPYTPLELEGRDIYIREGCNVCHSQMIRPFRSETERYGDYSKSGEYVYDYPHLWGSKRTGPDLMRVGGKYSDDWHYYHMLEPRQTSPGSIMPIYSWLFKNDLNPKYIESKISALQFLGVPYPEGYEKEAINDLNKQAEAIAKNLTSKGVKDVDQNKEIIAMIAYLQRLGTNIEPAK